MIVELFSIFLIFFTFLAFSAKRILTYLHLFQQDDYDGGRFFKWIFKTGTFDKKLSLGIIATTIAWYFIPAFIVNLILIAAFAFTIYKERDPRRDSKKKLAMTQRATRIFIIALVFSALPATGIFLMNTPWILLVSVQLVPFALLFGNLCLQPFEIMVQNKYASDAKAKLARVNPKVIAITGSFGKTSVKHILGNIL